MALNDGWFGLKNILSSLSRWQWSADKTIGFFRRDYMFNQQTPVLIDTSDAMTAYTDCPYLRLAIDKKCEMFANGQWKCIDAKDPEKEYPDDEALKLLRRPNPMQSGEDFLFQFMFYKSLFSNSFIYKNQTSKLVGPVTIWNLPSQHMRILFSDKIFDQVRIEDIIRKFILCYGGTEREYTPDDIIFKSENFSFDEGKGISRIPSLQLPISNIVAALKTRNIIATEKGMIGILSNETKDVVGGIQVGTKDRELIEEQFQKDRGLYGSRSKIAITDSNLKWQPMSFPTKDLALFEEIEEDFGAILGAFGLDRDLFPSVKGATFENKKQGLITTYQNTIQVEADSFADTMSDNLIPDGSRKLVLSYDWMPIMKEDEKTEAESEKLETDRLNILYQAGIISAEAFAQLSDVEFTGDGIIKGNTQGNTDVKQ